MLAEISRNKWDFGLKYNQRAADFKLLKKFNLYRWSAADSQLRSAFRLHLQNGSFFLIQKRRKQDHELTSV